MSYLEGIILKKSITNMISYIYIRTHILAQQIGLAEGASVLQAQQAMAVFSFFLFVVYGFFGAVLAIFRNDVVKESKSINYKDI